MSHTFCPGAKFLRQPTPEIFQCPSCGGEVEIWSDEIMGTCPVCDRRVFRDAHMGCLDWCQHAEDCVGADVYAKFLKNKTIGMKKKLIDQLEEYFQEDEKRINHAKIVLRLAEDILKDENADWHIVIPASILHDIGIKRAEEKYGSASAQYQEIEGPPVAEKILFGLGLKKEDIQEICDIIRYHHTPGKVQTSNFKVVYDADKLANLQDRGKDLEKGSGSNGIKKWIDQNLFTESARKMALTIYNKVDMEVQ